MICDLCDKEIQSHQMRHSDGNGDYHIVCEFNKIRKAMRMPPFESVRKLRYSDGFDKYQTKARETVGATRVLKRVAQVAERIA